MRYFIRREGGREGERERGRGREGERESEGGGQQQDNVILGRSRVAECGKLGHKGNW